MTNKPSPGIHGRGSGDVCADAQHYTVAALRTISTLMEQSQDETLRLACAKYLLEQAWGRPAIRKGDKATDEFDPVIRERFYKLLDRCGMSQLLLPN